MTAETFLRRLAVGKANHLLYSHDGKEGLISVWKHQEELILTWEECPPGSQYDESTYSRDTRHVFANISQLLDFLATNGLELDAFKP